MPHERVRASKLLQLRRWEVIRFALALLVLTAIQLSTIAPADACVRVRCRTEGSSGSSSGGG